MQIFSVNMLLRRAVKSCLLVCAALLFGCGTHQSVSQHTPAHTAPASGKEIRTESTTWVDSLLEDYVRLAHNPLVRNAVSGGLTVQSIFDDNIHTDTADYYIYQIGHDMTDDDGTSLRFVTDQWLYIDTLTHRCYEYNVAADSLMLWHI